MRGFFSFPYVGMHIHIVPNRKAAPTVLLRESYREGHKVCKRTLANLSDLSPLQIQAIRASLCGEVLQPVAQTFEICSSRSHGHVQAVSLAMQRLGLASLLASKPCREQGLVLAMVAQRIISPATKLATTRLWHTSGSWDFAQLRGHAGPRLLGPLLEPEL